MSSFGQEVGRRVREAMIAGDRQAVEELLNEQGGPEYARDLLASLSGDIARAKGDRRC